MLVCFNIHLLVGLSLGPSLNQRVTDKKQTGFSEGCMYSEKIDLSVCPNPDHDIVDPLAFQHGKLAQLLL